jgi:hypothetical protein
MDCRIIQKLQCSLKKYAQYKNLASLSAPVLCYTPIQLNWLCCVCSLSIWAPTDLLPEERLHGTNVWRALHNQSHTDTHGSDGNQRKHRRPSREKPICPGSVRELMVLMDTLSAAQWLTDALRALLHIKCGLIGRLQLTTMLPYGIRSGCSAGDGNRDMSFG